jgi:hypothetical protein
MGTTSFKDLRKNAMTVLTGDFPVVVEKVVHDKPSQSGKDMLRCTLKITSGPYAVRTINHMFTISAENPVSMNIFFRHMDVLGADEKFFDTDPTLASIAAQITDRHAIVTLAEDEYNGVKKEKVTGWKKATAAQVAVAGGAPLAACQAASLPAATVTVATPVSDASTPPVDPF